jgi:hypothetical protein
MSDTNTVKSKKYVASMSVAHQLDMPVESIIDVFLVDKPEESIRSEGLILFKIKGFLDSNKVESFSKHLYESLGLTARQEADGVYISGRGKTAEEVLSLLGETRDVFDALGKAGRKQERGR